jgi:hypothetical protein
MRYTVLLLSVVLAACATPQFAWHHATQSTWDAQKAEAECDLQAQMATAAVSNPFDAAFKRREIIDKCMAVRGFTRIRVG